MKRMGIAGLAVGVMAAGAVVAVPLMAQPERPDGQGRNGESQMLEIPAGDYINFVFAFSAGPGSTPGKPLRVSVEATSSRDELTLLVPAGETVVVPLAVGNRAWRAARPITVKLDQPARLVYGSGMTADGPLTFRPVKD